MIQRSERFTKAYDSLITAFFQSTLAKGNCMACACGNIIAGACGINFTKDELYEEIERTRLGHDDMSENALKITEQWAPRRIFYGPYILLIDEFKGVVNVAGYTTEEFARIEAAFEESSEIESLNYQDHTEEEILEDQYKGLCAVVDVLLELEGEEPGGDELKAKFREHPKLVAA